MDSIDFLRHLIQYHPLIDNHAHNILTRDAATDYDSFPLESITSEAHGRALENAPTTMALIRATRQLSELYGSPCTQWSDVVEAHSRWVEKDYEGLIRRSLEGTHALLLDDLLTDEDIEGYAWHDSFTASATKRIVRVEAMAADILKQIMNSERDPKDSVWSIFVKKFTDALEQAMQDPAVVGFKSVVCYRTGLDVSPHYSDEDSLTTSLHRILDSGTKRSGYRVDDKPLNDWLVQQTLKAITFKKRAKIVKPLQFHTGLGDNDINLVRANPAYLQPLIAQYPDADIVLLHSAYPYTRDAGYLACVYPNVYLDLGEVFPMVNRNGQEAIIREALEITPTNRLLWSTDGHFHPETFWLANKQFRQALEKVLVEYVNHDDYTIAQAKAAAADILFHNSNRLYNLGLKPHYTPSVSGPLICKQLPPDIPHQLAAFLRSYPNLEYVWMQWLDYTATPRVRIFPIQEFIKIARKERRIGVSLAVLSMLQDDTIVGGGDATGQLYLEPDYSSLYLNAGLSASAASSATVMTFWRTEDDKILEGCPRTALQNVVDKLHAKHKVDVKCGFEIELMLLKPVKDGSNRLTDYEPGTEIHSWSQITSDTREVLPVLEEVHQTLRSIGIELQQFHAESSPGQFEFVLPPASPLNAVDALIAARRVITAVSERHGYRATLHPRPFPKATGNASHIHLSISKPELESSFLAGILEHFTSVLAFALPQDTSYERVRPGIWAGSEWISWGFQNRESPIRKVSSGRWEFRPIDGLANPYLAVAGILASGLVGLDEKLPLKIKDCSVDASSLTDAERSKLGITRKLPKSLNESLRSLGSDGKLQKLLGMKLVHHYIAVKEAEARWLASMGEEKLRLWLIERY